MDMRCEEIIYSCGQGCECDSQVDRLLKLAGLTEDIHSYDLKARFDHFNKSLFGGTLPDIPLKWARMKGVSGECTAKVRRKEGAPPPMRGWLGKYDDKNKEIVPGTLQIRINNVFQRDHQGLDAILIHEMIHLALFMKGDFSHSHYGEFSEMAKSLGEQVGFVIPLTDAHEDKELATEKTKPVAVLMVKLKDGNYIYAMTTPNIARANMDAITEKLKSRIPYPGIKAGLYIVDTPGWTMRQAIDSLVRKFDYKMPWRILKHTDASMMELVKEVEQGQQILHFEA